MLANPRFLVVPILLAALSLLAAIGLPDNSNCKCRALNRLVMGGIEFTCSTDNCNATQACTPKVFNGTKWCMCHAGGGASNHDPFCFCKSGVVIATGVLICEALENCDTDPADGTGACEVEDPVSAAWQDQCSCYVAVPF